MEYWIFIVITLIAVFFICLVVFIFRCSEYKHVMRKMRTLSTSSSHQAESGRASGPGDHRAALPAPPPYAVSLRHPIIARGAASGDVTAAGPLPPAVSDELALNFRSGGSLPVDAYFIPPPYCVEPPAYCDVIADTPHAARQPEARRASTDC